MKKLKKTALLFVCSILGHVVYGQGITIETVMDTNVIELGRHAELKYEIIKKPGGNIQLPVIQDTLVEGVEVVSGPVYDSIKLEDGTLKINQKLTITSFEEGLYYIKPQPFAIQTPYGADTIYSKDSYLKVVGVQIDSAGVVRDIKSVEHVKRTFRDFLPFVIILLVIAIVLLIILVILPKLKKGREEEVEIEEKEPPYIIALRELDKLKAQKLWQQDQVKEYYSRLTGIIRKYLENQFSVQAMEETTREILRDIRLRGLDSKLNMVELEGLLNLADMIKFAKGKADPEENMEQLDNAYKLVKDTQNIITESQVSVKVDENDEFMKFVLSGIDLGMEKIRTGNQPVVPFVMARKGEEQKIQRFSSDDYNEAIGLAEGYLRKLQPKPDFALFVYEDFLKIEGVKNEALFVKGYDKKEQKGLVFAQRYQPKNNELDFQLIGEPALVGKEENILRQIDNGLKGIKN